MAWLLSFTVSKECFTYLGAIWGRSGLWQVWGVRSFGAFVQKSKQTPLHCGTSSASQLQISGNRITCSNVSTLPYDLKLVYQSQQFSFPFLKNKISLTHFSDKQVVVMVTSETCLESWFTPMIKDDWSLLPSILSNKALPRKAESILGIRLHPICFPFTIKKFNSPHLCFKGNLIISGAKELEVWHRVWFLVDYRWQININFFLKWGKCDYFFRDQPFCFFFLLYLLTA